MSSELIIDIWDIFKDSVSPKQKENKAYLLIKTFIDFEDFDPESLSGEDDTIDAAIELFREDEDDQYEEDEEY